MYYIFPNIQYRQKPYYNLVFNTENSKCLLISVFNKRIIKIENPL